MKRFLLLPILLLLFAFQTDEKPAGKPVCNGYFACTHAGVVTLSVQDFLNAIQKPLCAKDSMNNILSVHKFDMTYAERGLFQDSAGLPLITTEYSFAPCTGDSITAYWRNQFQERAYKGDTIFFDRIIARSSNNQIYSCKGIKVVLK
jgi:hypothetical protein